MGRRGLDDRLAALGSLGDALRRQLYRFVAEQDGAVSRDQAARAAGVSRAAAAFHLDRLVRDGLLDAEFRRLSGRTGPGAGRPSKLYRRAAREIAVSLPPREYEFAADLLAAAVAEATATAQPVDATLRRQARVRGEALAKGVPPKGARRTTKAAQVAAAVAALADQGYEPRLDDRDILLTNCPFHALATKHTELVCGTNHVLLQGFASALPGDLITAELDPAEGRCCVRLHVGRHPSTAGKRDDGRAESNG